MQEESLFDSPLAAMTRQLGRFLPAVTSRKKGHEVKRRVGELQLGVRVEENFYWLYQKYYRSLWAFFLNRGFSIADCEDLVQEVFIHVYRGIAEFRGDACFDTWLSRIAKNLLSNRIRDMKAQKRDALEMSWEELLETGEPEVERGTNPLERDPRDDVLFVERRTQLRKAIGDLPPQMRRCLALRFYSNYKYREIAAMMQISIEAVKSHLSQGKTRLKARLRGVFDQE